MIEQVKQILASQFDAALCMLNDCVEQCPAAQWDGIIAKYPFWHVAYHAVLRRSVPFARRSDVRAPRGLPPGRPP